MDLPLSRLGRTELTQTENAIYLKDIAFDNNLIVLTNSIRHGQYVAVVSCRDGLGIYRKLMAVTSIYDFETLGRRPLIRDLSIRLEEIGVAVEHLGIYHLREGQPYVGKVPVLTSPDEKSGEMICAEVEVC